MQDSHIESAVFPYGVDIIALRRDLEVLLETQLLSVDSLVRSSIRRQGQVATVRVAKSAKLSGQRDEWRILAGRALAVDADNKSALVIVIALIKVLLPATPNPKKSTTCVFLCPFFGVAYQA